MSARPLHLRNFPYYFLKVLVFDFEQYSAGKVLSYFCAIVHSISIFLQMHYLVKNFTKETMFQYGCVLTVLTYCVVALFFAIASGNFVEKLESEISSFVWPLDICGEDVKAAILKRAFYTSLVAYITIIAFPIFSVIMFPVLGDQSDMFLCVRVFNEYFTKWSQIPISLYFYSFPVIAFSGIRLPGMLLYAILITHIQMFLLNRRIEQISELSNQRRVFETLCSCIELQAKLKRLIRNVFQLVYIAMPIFILLGAVSSVFVLFFVVNSLETASYFLVLRMGCFFGANVLVVFIFSQSGQSFSDETGRIFDTLVMCSWYNWDKRNKKVLLMFLANSLEPMSITIAGITLDYKFALAMLRTSCSYALVLYQMKN
ncbi:uncharacterized protein LOC107398578 [Tribolium castaneum]|uniref:Odorant receptor n=1 Tax=Tribolium castaneum TaxID=7070 RepID=D6WUR4_TRICA|nr:PREDICTED: uncharacterized protein LOC107398578 isoform X2 [Tribolium castaneum]EFA09267.1 odorant receptor 229 [Tribolium castaneum]|eukprot:XP_015838540.1 PREDICTED: uncharacterized protein LOC107398578 isoform X2 [Tribolium castaneum]